jgi:transcriptional regulator with PAS, ATPase and Fis domain
MNHRVIERDAASGAAAVRTVRAPQLIGEHPLLDRVRSLVQKVAATSATVLVSGESGTGKEVVARMLHAASDRAAQPFVAVNCGAIPADLLESEMFGHERGAFTGAAGARAGMFQLAHRGTIFLDEIGDMSPALQVKLLRVLQEREVRPVGSDRSVVVDVRVIAATNQDLEAAVAAGRFREDLYYRLNVVPVPLPPLRERRSDIPLLVEHFLTKHTERHRRGPVRITEEAMVHLWEHAWPGNVRQLENLVERLVILCDGDVVDEDDLPPSLLTFITRRCIPDVVVTECGVDLNLVVEEFENGLITKALSRAHGNKQAAARLLGMNRTTLVAKLRRRADVFDAFSRPAFAA